MRNSIKKMALVIVALMAAAGVVRATLLTDSWSGSQAVPDGSPIGTANSLSISDPGNAAIEDVSVTLNISGGYDGDLYGYLVYQPSTSAAGAGSTASMIVLLDQIGTSPSDPLGESGAGLNVTLSDSGTVGNGNGGDIHNATGSPVTGIYTPDSPNTLDGTFGGLSADGTWTLFLADLTAGGGDSTLSNWSVNVSVVPEPITWALLGFAGILIVMKLRRYRNILKA